MSSSPKSPSRVHMRTMMALRLFAENGPFGSCARLMAYFEREKGPSFSKNCSSFRIGSFADNDGPICRRWPSWVLRLAKRRLFDPVLCSCCSVWQRVLQRVLQQVAVCCNVLQCVAVCCSVRHCNRIHKNAYLISLRVRYMHSTCSAWLI